MNAGPVTARELGEFGAVVYALGEVPRAGALIDGEFVGNVGNDDQGASAAAISSAEAKRAA
ncbi:MAG: hypothetical protein ABI421_09630, partial [Polyangiaceae bacterium]